MRWERIARSDCNCFDPGTDDAYSADPNYTNNAANYYAPANDPAHHPAPHDATVYASDDSVTIHRPKLFVFL